MFCIRVRQEGKLAFAAMNDFGSGKQMDQFARAEYAKQDRHGKAMPYKTGSMIGSGIRNIGKNKQKLEAEQNYYDAIRHIPDRVIS